MDAHSQHATLLRQRAAAPLTWGWADRHPRSCSPRGTSTSAASSSPSRPARAHRPPRMTSDRKSERTIGCTCCPQSCCMPLSGPPTFSSNPMSSTLLSSTNISAGSGSGALEASAGFGSGLARRLVTGTSSSSSSLDSSELLLVGSSSTVTIASTARPSAENVDCSHREGTLVGVSAQVPITSHTSTSLSSAKVVDAASDRADGHTNVLSRKHTAGVLRWHTSFDLHPVVTRLEASKDECTTAAMSDQILCR